MSDEKKCRMYTMEKSYDWCKFSELEKYFLKESGCSVPYVSSNVSICRNKTLKEEVPK